MTSRPPTARVRVWRLACKEWALLVRNPHALGTLFVMPALFVLVMSFTLKNTLTASVPFPETGWVLEDSTAPARRFVEDWRDRYRGPIFRTRDAMQHALQNRQIEAGVVVRTGWLDQEGQPRAEQLELWLGNRLQPASAARLRTELSFAVIQARMKIAAADAGPFASVLLNATQDLNPLLDARRSPTIRYLYEIESGRAMTAVQQSVPAWLVFGMFFVVIPVAGVLIQERADGTLVRLRLFGVSPGTILTGKLVAYLVLNLGQLLLMLIVGRFLVPLLGGDPLNLDVNVGWFVLMVMATSAAAVGLALLLAARSRSFEHAAALGGGLNVLLGALAGIMVPRMLMPPGLQTISEWSPMGWALDGLQSVFLGDPSAATLLPRAFLLATFGVMCIVMAWAPLKRAQA